MQKDKLVSHKNTKTDAKNLGKLTLNNILLSPIPIFFWDYSSQSHSQENFGGLF